LARVAGRGTSHAVAGLTILMDAAREITVRGVVQGVGFRPFVHRLATALGVSGSVWNDGAQVRIMARGTPTQLETLVARLERDAPPLARVEAVAVRRLSVADVPGDGFRIVDSTAAAREDEHGAAAHGTAAHGTAAHLTADAGICEACEAELLDPRNRRFRHAFISCTDCGPRWSMLEALPYDRVRTSMRAFALCPACAQEYATPTDRRFHAESVCCPQCGPTLRAMGPQRDGRGTDGDAITAAVATLRSGGIVALHGIGGFHLAVDATNPDAVARLRDRKQRPAKPFAVMVRTRADAERLVELDESAAMLLRGAERPVVVAPRVRAQASACAGGAHGGALARDVAPGLAELGVMLPSTAVQHLLLHDLGVPLVMTSGNASGEPLAATPDDAWRDLAGIADLLLLHDRPVVAPSDDTVLRREAQGVVWFRRARGWSPARLALPLPALTPVLGIGADLKATVALAHEGHAWLSPHLGDQAAWAVQQRTAHTVSRLIALSGVTPAVVACDAHPAYASVAMSARWRANASDAPWCDAPPPTVLPVQHHHAHVAAVMVEHGLTQPVVALAFDGAGWGPDGTVWGGEVLVADLTQVTRVGALWEAPLIGGDLAAREPWRAALGWLHDADDTLVRAATHGVPAAHVDVARLMAARGTTPRTSSMGRLFDAAAALLQVAPRNSYEGEAAARLEAMAAHEPTQAGQAFPFVTHADGTWRVDPRPALARLAEQRARGVRVARLAAQWHDDVTATAVAAALRACEAQTRARRERPLVVLCGGVFQNVRLLQAVRSALEAHDVVVCTARTLPPNDGAIAVGQVAIAAALQHDTARHFAAVSSTARREHASDPVPAALVAAHGGIG